MIAKTLLITQLQRDLNHLNAVIAPLTRLIEQWTALGDKYPLSHKRLTVNEQNSYAQLVLARNDTLSKLVAIEKDHQDSLKSQPVPPFNQGKKVIFP